MVCPPHGVPSTWCALHMEPSFYVGIRTNNGVEALNSSIKYVYLQSQGQFTLSTTITVLTEDLIPELWQYTIEPTTLLYSVFEVMNL
ncbi:hypothetical protein LSAT2_001606 [Lamellibrachia satsuma]|nr:hypothetical protein LSAT2_001606 [Lamellibrachia satsuma]